MIKNGRNGTTENIFSHIKIKARGYYIYEKGSKQKPDPSVLPITEDSKRIANIIPDEEKSICVSDGEILEVVFFPAVNEAMPCYR
ncbi:peroxisomal fatty acid beta-oxidation multifunctional protein aim1 [Quercus suber]|uniref:Peroxisomal fatty acid beta-oxidation multifunctional protein aim1 n=1 Tax=Quercus suber TaxID=58331 RepID=A0AAW0LJZ2_QUESU